MSGRTLPVSYFSLELQPEASGYCVSFTAFPPPDATLGPYDYPALTYMMRYVHAPSYLEDITEALASATGAQDTSTPWSYSPTDRTVRHPTRPVEWSAKRFLEGLVSDDQKIRIEQQLLRIPGLSVHR